MKPYWCALIDAGPKIGSLEREYVVVVADDLDKLSEELILEGPEQHYAMTHLGAAKAWHFQHPSEHPVEFDIDEPPTCAPSPYQAEPEYAKDPFSDCTCTWEGPLLKTTGVRADCPLHGSHPNQQRVTELAYTLHRPPATHPAQPTLF